MPTISPPSPVRAGLPALWAEHLGDDDHAFLHEVEEFARREIAPHAAEWEENEEIPRDAFTRAGAIGLLGMNTPRALGGKELGFVTSALAVRELARHQAAFALDVAAHNALGTGHLRAAATPAQLQKLFPQLADGTWLAAWALTEPDAGSDSSGIQTVATETVPGRWELTGTKRYITLGRQAEVLVIMAVSGRNEDGRKEISAFVVRQRDIVPVRKVPTCGMRASDTSEFRLERTPAELIGPRGTGQATALACLDKGRIGVASVSLGLARAALDAGLKHACRRQQFGRRLADFQALQFMLADCEVELRAAEALVLQAAIKANRGERHSVESSVAKLYATEAATRICDRMLQIHGGYGYTRDIPIERLWRDARIGQIGEGSSEVQRIVISRALLKDTEALLH